MSGHNGALKGATYRKVENRGWQPVRWDGGGGPVRYGWLMARRGAKARIGLAGDDRARWVPIAEVRALAHRGDLVGAPLATGGIR